MKFEFQVVSVLHAVANVYKCRQKLKQASITEITCFKKRFCILVATLRVRSRNHLFFRQLEAPSEC